MSETNKPKGTMAPFLSSFGVTLKIENIPATYASFFFKSNFSSYFNYGHLYFMGVLNLTLSGCPVFLIDGPIL